MWIKRKVSWRCYFCIALHINYYANKKHCFFWEVLQLRKDIIFYELYTISRRIVCNLPQLVYCTLSVKWAKIWVSGDNNDSGIYQFYVTARNQLQQMMH